MSRRRDGPGATESAARFARERCAAWDEVHRHFFPDYDERWTRAIELLRTPVGDGARIADLGCGPGSLTARLASGLDASCVLGVDLDPLLVGLARATHPSPSLRFVAADVLSPDAGRALRASGPFTAVVSSAFMHYFHVEQLEAVHALIGRILEPGGLLLTVERFAAPGAPVVVTETGSSRDPWRRWWLDTREEAPHHGFTLPPQAAEAAGAPPPLTREAYVESVSAAGFSVAAAETLAGGSTVIAATRRDRRDERG